MDIAADSESKNLMCRNLDRSDESGRLKNAEVTYGQGRYICQRSSARNFKPRIPDRMVPAPGDQDSLSDAVEELISYCGRNP
jgi:hypothetical protein